MIASNTAKTASLDEFMDRGRQFADVGGKGVPMKNYQPFTHFVLEHFVKKAEMINGEALLPTDGRPVVAIASHGPNIAWLPLAALADFFRTRRCFWYPASKTITNACWVRRPM